MSYDHLSINKITENGLELINRYDNIKSNNFNNILLTTNKYIIIGGKKYIYYIDYTNDKKINEKYSVKGEIICIYLINYNFFLASTSEGIILEIKINQNNKTEIKEKKFIDDEMNSLFLKNFKSLLFTSENNIQVWTILSKEDKNSAFNWIKNIF